MCETGINLSGRPDRSVTCGICKAYEFCNLPQARERRQQADNLLARFSKKARLKLAREPFLAETSTNN